MHRPRIALLVETSTFYGRSILAGINRYLMSHGDWSLFLELRALTSEVPIWLSRWKGDGIISRSTSPELMSIVKRRNVPLVELTDRFGIQGNSPRIRSNDTKIGQLAVAHLLERSFQNFAFCGFTGEAWSSRREKSFHDSVADNYHICESFNTVWGGEQANSWDVEQDLLADWLRKLPKPIGVMACSDIRAQHILNVCRQIGIASPEEVAVIGVDNDELLCSFCRPTLSSIIPNAEEIGYRAAEVMQQLLETGKASQDEQIVDPIGIVARQSTDVSAIADPDVAAAVRLIREEACSGLTVADVLSQVPLSRSALERSFRKFLKRSPQSEIRRVRLNRVMQLLSETDLSLARIATLTGFEHPEYLSVMFKRDLGCTPGDYRKSLPNAQRTPTM